MSKINPLHIIALLIVVIVYLFVQIVSLEHEVKGTMSVLNESRDIAFKLDSYKKTYANEKNRQQRLKRILTQRSMKQAKFIITKKAKSCVVSSQSVSLDILNSFMNKIINGNYNIQLLKIKRKDDKHVSLKMEIAC